VNLGLEYDRSAVFLSKSANSFSIEVEGKEEVENAPPLEVDIKRLSGPSIEYDADVKNDTVMLNVQPALVELSDLLSLEVTVTQGSNIVKEMIEIPVVNEKQVKDTAPFDFSAVNPYADHQCVAQEGLDADEPEPEASLMKVYENISLQGVVEMKQIPGDNEYWYVLDYTTQTLKRFRFDGSDTTLETVLNLIDKPGIPYNFVFHPNFSNNGKFYVYTYLNGGGQITEYTWSHTDSFVDPDSAINILTAIPPETELEKQDHPGGGMHFGPDGYLYVAFGDFTRPEIFNNAVQDMSSFAGKMIRIDVDGGYPYAIPADNPFAGQVGEEIFALGFRHPWKWSFDSLTGDIWLGDVGWTTKEEVNIVTAGGNYGWPIYEGSGFCPGCPQKDSDHGLDLESMIPPIHEYGTPEEGPAKSVTGGFVYRGTEIPNLYGKYIFGEFIHGKVWSLSLEGDTYTKTQLDQLPIGLAAFAQDNQGELYALDFYTGDIYKLVTRSSLSTDSVFSSKLSETGCVNIFDPLTPPAGAIPFDVQVPLWSDAAEKTRWLFLPKDSKIGSLKGTVDGDLDYPIGTVMVKHFKLQGKIIETRLLVHRKNGEWSGFSYEWNDEATDAALLSEAKEKLIGGQTWSYPNRSQCLQCHTNAAGRSLGPTTAQLNTFHDDLGEVKSQLAELKRLNIFSFDVDESIQYASLGNDDAPIADKARAYLDSNCSGCHRPGGGAGRAEIDLRAGVPFSETGLCNIASKVDNLGVVNGKLIVPGDVYSSLLAIRVSTREAYKMPLLGSNVVDDEGVTLINSWIDSLVSCDDF